MRLFYGRELDITINSAWGKKEKRVSRGQRGMAGCMKQMLEWWKKKRRVTSER